MSPSPRDSSRRSSDPYLGEAERLFAKLFPMWEQSDNVWRAGWVLDTLIDYFVACGEDGSIIQDPLAPLSPTKQGNWWDDFAWVGIATLRAAELEIFPKLRDDLVKAAINAWAYMHGPSWSKTKKGPFPFTDLEGWSDFRPEAAQKIGAPNAWSKIHETWKDGGPSPRQVGERRPRYSPGGVWNAPICNACSPDVVFENPDCRTGEVALAPIQNTVTNGLYSILSLRLWSASKSGAYGSLFDAAELNLEECKKAWESQLSWFESWIYDTHGDESLALTLKPKKFFVRERVSTFYEYDRQRPWDGGYCSRLVWTGDQGLMLGFLREAERASGADRGPRFAGAYRQIISAVFEHAYAPRQYAKTGVKGMFLLPWLRMEAKSKPEDPYRTAPPGGKDYGDYQTGNAVFMRYLLQAYRDDRSVIDDYGDLVTGAAKLMTEKGFGEAVFPSGCCDAYMPIDQCGDHRPANGMTPLVNRLSVLLMAHELESVAAD